MKKRVTLLKEVGKSLMCNDQESKQVFVGIEGETAVEGPIDYCCYINFICNIPIQVN